MYNLNKISRKSNLNTCTIKSNSKLISSHLFNDGYVVIKNLLSDKEISKLKSVFANKKYLDSFINETNNNSYGLPNASHTIKEISDLVANPKLIEIMKLAFVNQPFCFTSHSDLLLNVVSPWHKDDGKGSYFEGFPDYIKSDSCKVYKVGIYLHDCSKSGGLSVKPGSHLSGYKLFGLDYNSSHDELYLNSNLGDIIIFDVRITHKGDSLSSSSFIERIKRKLGFFKDKILDYERQSIFFSYGLDNKYSKVFADKNMERQVKQLRDSASKMIPDRLSSKLKSQGVGFYCVK